MSESSYSLLDHARAGDEHALDRLLRPLQGMVYNLALRFLWHPEDAEDATQEILVRVVTGLPSFRGDSRFETWAYRIACNTLLTLRRQRMEEKAFTFERFAEDLRIGASDAPLQVESWEDEKLLLEEVRIGCTLGMLLCLDREHRIAYILGEILELDHNEAAEVLEIEPAAYRKRLSRARADIVAFTTAHCGLVNPENACRCRRRVNAAITLERVVPAHLLFTSTPAQSRRFPVVLAEIRRLEADRRAAALYRAQGEALPSTTLIGWLRELVREYRRRQAPRGAQ
ncbi:MAG TPA: RNA polymerase sigma factor [Candidatus Polarisedimenticolia bacterium]|nr:RNA polymerase sigma factor [Candidatus Polarisedimenticolia bacterium]